MVALNQTTFMTGCLTEGVQISRREPIFYGTDISVFMLISVIINLKWTSVCIIFDKETEKEALQFHERISYFDIFAVTYDMEGLTSSDIDDLLDAYSTNAQKIVKFIVYCHSQLCEKFLSQPFDFGRKHVRRNSLLHFSMWIVVIFHGDEQHQFEGNPNISFDNVAVISFFNVSGNQKQNYKHYSNHKYGWLQIQTLMWKESRRRQFSEVGYVHLNGSLLLPKDTIILNANGSDRLEKIVFPNIKFGFNQRKFLVSILPLNIYEENISVPTDETTLAMCFGNIILREHAMKNILTIFNDNNVNSPRLLKMASDILTKPLSEYNFSLSKMYYPKAIKLANWKPYVEIDEETKKYKGMTIELLNELSRRLNFTYELRTPPDGKWGVVSGNNIWNGMIGQLQRREVDMVAAPLVIDVLRETVADFTQPYFYEQSGIIITKPVTSYSTKLHDPVNPKVCLCIGLSLIVVTFCLFLFEKFNPFYKNVAGRMEIRGLHHFSDSFWYMFGAILCHGGQHVAASSAGKTLLSCWWIFCIIMAATYSGNFVAILTVTKEKLPFKDAEGLVAQHTYKWGTAGATVFETILKNSELPERKMLWQGILKFNQSDPSVLSSDPAEHIRKVRGGNYAYIGERIYLDMAIGKSCDMSVISSSDFHPLLIAPALPNNSPFLNVFSDEIVTIVQTGLIQMWQKKTWPKPANCQDASGTDAKTINVFDFHFAFCLSGLGVILAILSLIYEHIKRKWILTQRRRQNEQGKKMSLKDISPIDEFYKSINAVNETPLKIAIRRQITDTPRSFENKRKNYFN